MNWKIWLSGLISAFIGGGATGVTVIVVDPLQFNFDTGWKKLLTVCVVSGIVSAAAYLKQSPIPSD